MLSSLIHSLVHSFSVFIMHLLGTSLSTSPGHHLGELGIFIILQIEGVDPSLLPTPHQVKGAIITPSPRDLLASKLASEVTRFRAAKMDVVEQQPTRGRCGPAHRAPHSGPSR